MEISRIPSAFFFCFSCTDQQFPDINRKRNFHVTVHVYKDFKVPQNHLEQPLTSSISEDTLDSIHHMTD